jgi:hypothetical protein
MSLQTLLGALTQGPSDQKLKDIELAIKHGLEDRNAAGAKSVNVAKAVRSSSSAASTRGQFLLLLRSMETADT